MLNLFLHPSKKTIKIILIVYLFWGCVNFGFTQIEKRVISTVNSNYESGMVKLASIHNQLYAFGFGGAKLQFGYSQFNQTTGVKKLFVSKYNDTGLYIKSITLGGLGVNTNGGACSLGNNLTCYSGSFSGEYFENNVKIPSTNKGMFVVALDSGLNTAWRLFIKANKEFHCNLLCPDGTGNLVAAGYYTDSLQAGSFRFKSARKSNQVTLNKDIFLLRINSSGMVVNAQTFGGYGNDYPTSIVCDQRGNVFVSSIISDTVTLANLYYPQQGNSRCIVFQYNWSGQTKWVNALSGVGVVSNGLSLSKENQLVCGLQFKSSLFVKTKSKTQKLSSSANFNQIGVLIFDTAGVLQNYTTEGSENECNLTSLTVDAANNIFVTGGFKCTFTGFNKKNPSWSFRNIGFGDIYVAAYSSTLKPLYQRHFGGTEEDVSQHIIIWKSKPVVCGIFKSNLQLTCDSNITATVNVWSNYSLTAQYNSTNPQSFRNLMNLYYDGLLNNCGFFTDIVDSKAQLNNHLQRIYGASIPFTEKAKWDSDLSQDPIVNCGNTYLRYFWIQQFSYRSRWGTNLEYRLNGRIVTYNELLDYKFDKTTYHELIMNTADQCYSDTLSKTHVVNNIDYAVINYDKSKFPYLPNNSILLCKGDSVCLTASNTKGLDYYWLVGEIVYVLDSVLVDGKYEKQLTLKVDHYDTIRKPTICINKRAVVDLVVAKNNICLFGNSLKIEQDGLGPNDSLVYYFEDTATYYCKGGSVPQNTFKIKVLDKKTGLYRNPVIWSTLNITNYNSFPQAEFDVQVPDTGKLRVKGKVQIGCEVFDISLSKKVYVIKHQLKIMGTLSNCHSAERIFSVDSGYQKYQWNIYGLPDTPQITYITPWKVKVVGSSNSIWAMAYADTNPKKTCVVSDFKYVFSPDRVNIKSSFNQSLLCPGSSITLSAGNAKEYLWFPSGETTQNITINEPGLYYCMVKDTADCAYNTNKILISGFFEPDILTEPDWGICAGQEAEINVIAPENSVVNWVNPTSWGSKLKVTTSQPGNYLCEVKVCNQTYKLKAQVFNTVLNHQLHKSVYKICEGQSLTLQSHDSETYTYQWAPVISNKRWANVNAEGIYTVKSKDLCDDWYLSDSIEVVKEMGFGNAGTLDTLICDLKPTIIDLRRNYLKVDSNVTCRWIDNWDTSFLRTFPSGNQKAAALIKNKYCTVSDTFFVNILLHKTPLVKIIPTLPVCKGDSVKIEAYLSDSSFNKKDIQWNNGLGSGSIVLLKAIAPKKISATYTDICGTSADSVEIIPVSVQAQITESYDLQEDSFTLVNSSVGSNISKVNWYVNRQFYGNNDVVYLKSPIDRVNWACLFIENNIGCKDSICKKLVSLSDGNIYIPNVFYPDSKIDKNWRFEPVFSKNIEYEMTIYNRWGEKIFRGNNATRGWDGYYMGEKCMSGLYVYLIKATYTNKNQIQQSEIYSGTVLLME